jgi:hypothetical protein
MAVVSRTQAARVVAYRLEVLIEIQAKIKHCRLLADQISDPEAAERVRQLADDVERRARELDLE